MWPEAFGLFKEQSTSDEVIYNAAMNACRNGSEWRHSLHLFNEILFRKEYPLRSASLMAVVDACGQASEWLRALEQLYTYKSQADVSAFTAAIHACEANRNWSLALALFDEAPEPDLPCFGAVMATCAAASRWMDVIHFLTKMTGHQIKADAVCRTAVMDAFAKKSLWVRALSFLNSLFQNHLPTSCAADLIAFGSTMASFQEASEWERALHLWHNSTSTNYATSGSLLLALRSSGKWFHSAVIFQQVQDVHAGHHVVVLYTAEQHLQPTAARQVFKASMSRISSADEMDLVLYSSLLQNLPTPTLERRLWRKVFYPLELALKQSSVHKANEAHVPHVPLKIVKAASGLGSRTRDVLESFLQTSLPSLPKVEIHYAKGALRMPTLM